MKIKHGFINNNASTGKTFTRILGRAVSPCSVPVLV